MPSFKPDPRIQNQILTLLSLWVDKVESSANLDEDRSRLLQPTMPTKTFLQMLNNVSGNRLSYETLAQYIQNIPAISALVDPANTNKNTIAVLDPNAEPMADMGTDQPADELAAEQPAPDLVAEPPADDMGTEPMPAPPAMPAPAEPVMPAPAEPVMPAPAEPVMTAGPDRASIVAQMAKRARDRARR